MPLSDDDVREILRLIDESDVRELRVETGALLVLQARPVTVRKEAPTLSGSALSLVMSTFGASTDTPTDS